MNKQSFIWNMLGSGLYAAATILFLMIAKRCAGEEAGSQFYMAFTTGQMLLTIGYFEIRPFQSTDVDFAYRFGDYLGFRLITSGIMFVGGILVAAVYAIFRGTPIAGILLILALTVYKMFDALADVFEGEFQRRERMERSGQSMFIRVAAAMVVFTGICAFTKDVLYGAIGAVLAALICLIITDIPWMRKMDSDGLKPVFSRVKELFGSTLFLFLGSAMCMWIWNGTKYVVEWTGDETRTLVYGIVFMPTMVINLGSGFLFKPMLTTLARYYSERDRKGFFKTLMIMVGGAAVMTVVCLAGAYVLGVPVLSAIYAIDLTAYKGVLLWLLVGGGLNAEGIIFYYALTTMRRTGLIFGGYLATLLVSIVLPVMMIPAMGIAGAAWSYVILMALLTAIFAIMTIFAVRKW